jgi:hypothetical protein
MQPGDTFTLFNAEDVTALAPQASVAVAMGYGPGGGANPPVVFAISFASAPTDSLVIQASNTDVDADYQTLSTSTNKQHDYYADQGGFAYYRAKMVTQSAGGAVTIIAKR